MHHNTGYNPVGACIMLYCLGSLLWMGVLMWMDDDFDNWSVSWQLLLWPIAIIVFIIKRIKGNDRN